MALILPGNVASAIGAGYEVANSCRFNRADSASMHITFSGAGDRQKFTFSFWVKRNKLGTQEVIFDTNFDGGASEHRILFDSSDRLEYYDYASSSTTLKYVTTRVFRDTSAWYSIIIAVDTTQGTAGNRVKIYINGTQETSFGTETQPDEDLSTSLNTAVKHQIGTKNTGFNYLDVYLAEFVFIDGTQYAASDFGEFDSDSPTIWKPIDVSGLTFGTNGFYLDFEDSADLGKDVSGNGNDLTVSNLDATDSATDVPTNNFATLNPLFFSAERYTIEEGNLQITANVSSAWRSLYTTMPVTSGKWYFETKVDGIKDGSGNNIAIGIVDIEQVDQTLNNGKFFGTSRGYGYNGMNGQKLTNDTVTANGADYGDAYTAGDIVGCALDLDNQKIYWSKDGTWQDSGDPTSGATGTGSAFDIGSGYTYTPVIANYYTEENYSFNFGGCPAFAISSGNADADGYGNFEYAVPSGYYALCTKNLAEYG